MGRDSGVPPGERLFAWGAALALAFFYLWTLGRPSLWLDEAWEANYYVGNVPAPWMNRPILTMLAQKGMAALFGPSEFALRFLPCLAALATVATLWTVARRSIGRAEAWLAAAMLAFGPAFLFHAHQLKHYPFEALATALLLAAYARWREIRTTRRAVLYGAVAALCVTISFTTPIVVAALLLVEAASSWRAWPSLVRFAGATGAAAAVFVPLYLAFHAADSREGLLREYWVEGFLPWRSPAAVPSWLVSGTLGILKEHTGAASGVAVGFLALAGAAAFPRSARWIAWSFASALGVHVLASAAGAYPFASARLTLYASPWIALVLGGAFGALIREGPARPARVLAAAGLAYATFHGAATGAVPYLTTGWRGEDIRDLVSALDRERLPGDAIYVHEDAAPAFSFYWRRLGHRPPFPEVRWAPGLRDDPERHAEGVAGLASTHERVWGLYTHAPKDEIRALRRAFLVRYEAVSERFVEPDAWLDLWKRRPALASTDGSLEVSERP